MNKKLKFLLLATTSLLSFNATGYARVPQAISEEPLVESLVTPTSPKSLIPTALSLSVSCDTAVTEEQATTSTRFSAFFSSLRDKITLDNIINSGIFAASSAFGYISAGALSSARIVEPENAYAFGASIGLFTGYVAWKTKNIIKNQGLGELFSFTHSYSTPGIPHAAPRATPSLESLRLKDREEENARLNQRLRQVQSENQGSLTTLRSQVREKTTEIERLKQEIARLKTPSPRTPVDESTRARSSTPIDESTRARSSAPVAPHVDAERIRELETNLLARQREVETLRSSMQEERERLTAHHQEELSGLREQLRNAEIEFQRRSHETTSAHRSREEELTQRLSQTSLTSTENSDLRRQLETAQRDHREELETLRTQHQSNLRGIEERFQSRIETLEKDIRSATEAKERLLSQHREQLEELEQTHRIHTIDLNSQLATQSEELERLRASSPSSGGDSETQRLQTTISKLQRELLGAKDQFNRTKEQLEEALQANIEQENEALKVARQQVVAQQSEIERLTERLESVSSANRGLVRQRDELQIRNTQLLKLVTDKEIEFRNREREITQRFNQRIRELTEEASQLRASNNSFVDENRSLTEKARRLEQEKRALASSNASLREDNTQLREESDDLGRSLQAHVLLVQRKTSEKQAVERQLEESERQASELRTTVRDLEGTQRDLTAENDLHKQMLVQMIGSVSLYHLALQGEDISSVDESTLTAESIKLLAKMKKMPTLLNTVLQQVMESVKAATTQPTETHSDESTPSPALGVSPSVVAVEPSPSVVVSTPIVETENEVTESSTSSDDTDIIAHNRRVPRTVLMPLQRQIRELTEQLDAANAQIRKLKRKATSRGAVARVDTGLKRTPSASATAVH